MKQVNPYGFVKALLISVVTETPTIKTFKLKPEEPFTFKAGQFAEVGIPGIGEAPFTPSSSPYVTDEVEFTIMKVGRVTEKLHSLKAGAELTLRGPLGMPYPIEKYKDKEVLIVGGGVGLAPLRALLFALFEHMQNYRRVIVRYGARTPNDIVYRDAIMNKWGKDGMLDVMLTVDRGDETWKGHVGVVTTILEKEFLKVDVKKAVAVVCGPPIMMKFTTLKLIEIGFSDDSIYLSMEKNMSCGIGKCGHCRIGKYYACKDGPVFTYAQVKDAPNIWD